MRVLGRRRRVNTPSHALIAAALRRAAPGRQIPLSAVLWGSVAPDIPLFLLVAGGGVYYCGVLGWTLQRALDRMLGTLYVQDPFWLAARSTLHAPLVIGAVLAVALTAGRERAWGRWLAWCAAALFLHAVLDILTHVSDGPLLLFPLDRHLRFHSVVSYWDPRYHGRLFSALELALDVVLTVYLALGCRFRRASTPPAARA